MEITRHALDTKFADWGESKYYSLKLEHTITTKDLLSHLYVLIPALDYNKHYFVSEDEVTKLLQKGEGWLNNHPEKDQIINRYLINLKSLSKQAINRLNEDEKYFGMDEQPLVKSEVQQQKESLHNKRIRMVADKLLESGAKSVIDLGCGEGKLIRQLIKHQQFSRIAGMDISYNELLKAKERMHYDEMSPSQKERINLFQGSLTYKDAQLNGFEAAAIVEVIEHLDLKRLKAFERVVFEFARPQTIVLTTPNKEFNSVWDRMGEDEMRHDDHRFEWNRQEFKDWVSSISSKYNYTAEIFSVGDEIENVGSPSQMAIFTYGN